jgi:hypothetical protein
MGNEQLNKVFTTLDAYLAGYLSLKEFIPKLIEQGEKVVFCFDASDELYNAIAEYNAGAKIEASRLALATKALKSQIHSLRRNKGKWERSKDSDID